MTVQEMIDGFSSGKINLNFKKMIERKDGVVHSLDVMQLETKDF